MNWPKTITYPLPSIVISESKSGKKTTKAWNQSQQGLKRTKLAERGEQYTLFRHGDDYALYVCPLQFGYAKAIEFNTYINQASNRKVVDIRFLAGNSVGVTPDGRPRSVKDPLTLNWKPVKEEFYRSIEEALVVVRGQRSGTGRGRPKEIKPLTLAELTT